MFIGHFAVGLGAKKYAPRVSLGVLFIAAQFLDLLWPNLLLADMEHVAIVPGETPPLHFTDYPISHSLAMVLLWGLLWAVVAFMILKRRRDAIVIFVCVVSHWFLDWLVHIPDLPLWPGDSPLLGLSLWAQPVIANSLEILLFAWGIYLYVKATQPVTKFGTYGFVGLIAFLGLIHIANMFGSAPPSVTAIAWAGQLQWLFVILAFFVDRKRRSHS